MEAVVDARRLSKLRWRCRRGLLENDLFIERFFARHAATLTEHQAQGLQRLMDLADNDLLDLLLRRTEPSGALDRADVVEVLGLMRTDRSRLTPHFDEDAPANFAASPFDSTHKERS